MLKKQNNDLRVNDLGEKQTHSLKSNIKVDVVTHAWNPYMLCVYKQISEKNDYFGELLDW